MTWAAEVSQQYIDAEKKAVAINDFAQAAYWLLTRQDHEREVERAKGNYRGL